MDSEKKPKYNSWNSRHSVFKRSWYISKWLRLQIGYDEHLVGSIAIPYFHWLVLKSDLNPKRENNILISKTIVTWNRVQLWTIDVADLKARPVSLRIPYFPHSVNEIVFSSIPQMIPKSNFTNAIPTPQKIYSKFYDSIFTNDISTHQNIIPAVRTL